MTEVSGSLSQATVGAELAANGKLRDFQDYLVDHATSALKATSFEQRNREMATTVADESAILAADALRLAGKAERTGQPVSLRDVFYRAVEEAGAAFGPTGDGTDTRTSAFDSAGHKIAGHDAQYQAAVGKVRQIAVRYAPGAQLASGLDDVDARAVLRNLGMNDVIGLTAAHLGVDAPAGLSAQAVKESLHETATGDAFNNQIDTLPFSGVGAGSALSDNEQAVVNLVVRLSDATRKVGYLHSLAWELEDNRIDDATLRTVFAPYDLRMHDQYQRLLQEGRTPEQALVRVAFEMWNDDIDPLRQVGGTLDADHPIGVDAIAAARSSKSLVPAPEVIPPGAMTRQEAWAAFGADEGTNPVDAAQLLQQLAGNKNKQKPSHPGDQRPTNADLHAGEPQHVATVEQAKRLQAAVAQVARLVQGERVAPVLGSDPAKGAAVWESAQAAHPEYAQQILALRDSLLHAAQTKREYSGAVTAVLESNFDAISDPKARDLLADILLSRLGTTPGYIDNDRNVEVATGVLAGELGAGGEEPGSWNEDVTQSLTQDDVIAAILEGRVHLLPDH